MDVFDFRIVTRKGLHGGDGGYTQFNRPLWATTDEAARRVTATQVGFKLIGCNYRIEVQFMNGHTVATHNADLCDHHTLVIGPSGLVGLLP